MKVRIVSNKIRFRLKEPEVRLFQEVGSVAEVLSFGVQPEDEMTFLLQVTSLPQLSVEYQRNKLVVGVPGELAKRWTSSALVGFEEKVDTGKGKLVHLLVEKDFVCLDGREEENEGSYPNPLAGNDAL